MQSKKIQGLWSLLIPFLGSLILAAIVAPLAHKSIIYLNQKISCASLNYLASKRIEHYFDRVRLLSLFLFLPWVLRRYQLNSWSKLGLTRDHQQKTLLTFTLGIMLVALLMLPFLYWGQIVLKHVSLEMFAKSLLGALAASLLIALIEEVIFRGIVLNVLSNYFPSLKSLLLGSFIFSILHFSTPNNFVASETWPWINGILLAWHSLLGMVSGIKWLYFLNLFALGSIFGIFYLQERHLWDSIGFHWGIVFALLLIRKNLDIQFDQLPRLLGDGRITNSWLSLAVMSVIAYFFYRYSRLNESLGSRGQTEL